MIHTLFERRMNLWERMKELVDRAEAESRSFDATEDEEWAKLNGELSALDARIQEIKDAETRASEIGTVELPKPKVEARVAKEEEAVKAFLAGERRSLEFNLREGRALTTGGGAGESNTIPTTFVGRLYEHLVEMSPLRGTNVSVVTTDSGEAMQFPKTTAHTAAAGIIAEGTQIGEALPSFGLVTLNAYKYAHLRQISREMGQDTGVNLLDYLARDSARAVALGTSNHYWNGSGTGQPNGIVTASTLGKTGASGNAGVPQADELIDLFYSVIAPYRVNARWAMSDATAAAVRKLKESGSGQYIWQPGLQGGQPDMILGKPVVIDTFVPDAALGAKSVVFGDLSAYLIRDVGAIRLERSDDFAFDTDLVTYRVIFRTDGDLLDTSGALKHFIGNAA